MPSEQPVSVTGSVTYRERLALPPTAQVEIRIDDVSLADAPSRTVARQSFTADGRQVPFAFRLTVDRRQQIGRATSELQSLMRISYALFCLKKNNKKHYDK